MTDKKPNIEKLDRQLGQFFRRGDLSQTDREKVEKWTEYFKEKVERKDD